MYQTLILVGHLGRDPEMRYLPSGQPVCNFSVCTDRQYTNGDGDQVKEATWFNISTFGKQAEVCSEYLHKGRLVLVEGRLRPDKTGNPRVFQRQDGSHGAAYEVTAINVRFLTANQAKALEESGAGVTEGERVSEEEIPF